MEGQTPPGPSAPQPPPDKAGHLAAVANLVSVYIRHSRATNTVEAYQSDWKRFTQWCETYDRTPLPATPETVAFYLSDTSSHLKPSTLSRHMASISQAHRKVGLEPPTRDVTVRMVMAGIRRDHGTARVSKKAILVSDLKRVVSILPDSLLGKRDRALLLMGFFGALRRSELVALDNSDVAVTPEGLVVTIRRSKTDQLAHGRRVGLPYTGSPETCPVRSFERWIEASGITEGAIFRPITRHGKILRNRLTSHAVATTVKRWVQQVGLDARQFSGHSLRSGLATAASISGASERAIMNQTGHRSITMVRRYVQSVSLFKDNVGVRLGL